MTETAPPREGPPATHAVLYTDGGLRADRAGAGYVARCGNRLVLGNAPLAATKGSNDVELEAATLGLDRILDAFPGLRSIELRSDNSSVGGQGVVTREIAAALSDIRALCSTAGVVLTRRWIRGHAGCGTATGFLNSVTHVLATMALDGESCRSEAIHDAFWRLRLMDCAPRLIRHDMGPTRAEAAHILGVGTDVIRDLVASRHLRPVKGSERLDPTRFLSVWREAATHGAPWAEAIPAMPDALARRGFIDDIESGVRLAPAPGRPVRISLRLQRVGTSMAAGWTIETPDAAASFSLRTPIDGTPHWVPGLRAALAEALSLCPDCDDILLSTDDATSVAILNRNMPPHRSAVAFLLDLDETLDARRIEFRAEVPCRDSAVMAWDNAGRLAREMAEAAAGNRLLGPFRGATALAIARSMRIDPLTMMHPSHLAMA